MQDDKINNDDFDDLDFEDLDDDDPEDSGALIDDDLGSEDLDDDFPEDDDFSDDDWGDEDAAAGTEDISTTKTAGSKRSSKIILPLVVGVAIIGAGGFYIMNSAGTGAPQPIPMDSSNTISADSDIDITENSLPMPSPMASPVEGEELGLDFAESAENTDAAFDPPTQNAAQDNGQAGTFVEDDVLTPMPGLQDVGQDSTVPLESLGLSDAADTRENNVHGQDLSANITQRDMANDQSDTLSDPPELGDDEPAPFSLNADTDADTGAGMDTAGLSKNTANRDIAGTIDAAESRVSIEAYEGKIETLENNLKGKDEAIQNLNTEIETLEKRLSRNEAALKEARIALEKQRNEMASLPKTEPESITQKSPDTTKPSPKPSPKPQAITQAEIMPKWELRAAQPGRAYIGIMGSKDVQVVETGDTLQGIGQIEIIALEDGVWVVQGTNGVIKQ